MTSCTFWNPNSDLAVRGTLLEGAQAWFCSIAGGTGAIFLLPSSRPKLLCSLNFSCWFLAATGVDIPPLFLPNLGEDGTDMSMGAPEDGAKTMMLEGPTGSNPSSSKRRRRYPSRKVVALKNCHSLRLSASLPQGSGEASDRPVALTTSDSTPMVIETEDSIAEIPTAEGWEVETVAARRRIPHTPRAHNLIMDLAGALVISLDPELSGTVLLEAVER